MTTASLSLIMLTLSGYVFTCSMPKIIDQAKPFPIGDYLYTGYDKDGGRIVEGRLSITSVEPRRSKHEESYEIKSPLINRTFQTAVSPCTMKSSAFNLAL